MTQRSERLGDLAVRLGYVTDEQRQRALREQEQNRQQGRPAPIGALMVRMGALAPAQLARLLAERAGSGFSLSEDSVRLAAHFHASLTSPHDAVMFVGARRGDGSSTIAAQSALALALMDHGSILLIDADLRKPSAHQRFGLDVSPGLADVIAGRTEVQDAVRETGVAGLSVMPAGTPRQGEGAAALLSESCAQTLDRLRQQFTVTILDASPILDHPEAAMLASRAAGAVLVIRAGARGQAEVNEAERILNGVGVRTLGVVLSRDGKARRRTRQEKR